MIDARDVLRKHWGYDDFRGGQREIIDTILAGNDVMAIMPTGSGKSICYQIPAILSDGLTVVVSPLISLMHDQVIRLKKQHVQATYIDSTLEYDEIKKRLTSAARGEYTLLYLSPERLQTALLQTVASALDVSILAIDEAHCVSKWGVDFRPEYYQIPKFIKLLKRRPTIAAFTATASLKTREDIAEHLELNNPKTVVTGFERENLTIQVEHVADKDEQRAIAQEFVWQHRRESGIVYCLTRKEVDAVSKQLRTRGINCLPYHAGKTDAYRETALKRFLSGDVPIIVATSAFGMGIDKPDIRFVLSLGMRDTLEDYYQNIGRAGRDGDTSDCLLLGTDNDISLWKWLVKKSLEDSDLSALEQATELAHKEKELEKVKRFCTTRQCRHQFILDHFGERKKVACAACDNCVDTQLLPSNGKAPKPSGDKVSAAEKRRIRRAAQHAKPYYDDDEAKHVTKSGRVRRSYAERYGRG